MSGPILVGGIEYSVEVVDDTDPLEEGLDGYTDFASGSIIVRKSTYSRVFATLVHEVLHAAFDASPVEYLIEQLCNEVGADAEQVQELLIRSLAPSLIPALEGLEQWRASLSHEQSTA